MATMNKIIREHYPVSRLPADLQEEVGAAKFVHLVIDIETPSPPPSREKLLELLSEARKFAPGISTEEAVARVRALRDEWDD